MGKTRDYNGLADYIIQEEGFLDKPTNIGDGKITLGSGLTDPKWHNLYKQRGNKWSKEDNKKAVIEEIKMREKILADSFPNWDKLPIDSQNALISYKYNYNFTPSNSPKLYQAARDFNYLNMAAQMDATSKDPKFRKGLMERRKREQEMFLSGFPSGRSIVKTTSPAVEQPDATTVYNPYPVQFEYMKPAPIMVPDEGSYVTAHRLTDSEIRAQQIQEKFDAINRYNALMDSISVQNNPTSQYKPQNAPYVVAPYAEGGFMQPKDAWDKLSLQEKSAMMRAAVRQGIYNLKDIRQKYNEFAEGGSKGEDEEVNTNSYSVGNLVNALYQNNPKEKYLGEPEHHYDFTQSEEWANAHGYYPDARGHRDDRVKKPAHPSHPSRGVWDGDKFVLTDFGMQNPNYTLFGLNGGGQDPQATLIYNNSVVLPELTVTPNENYFFNPYDNIELHYAKGGSIHIKPSHRGRLTELKKRTGKSEAELYRTGSPATRKMITFARNARKWKHGLGGNLFDGTTQPSQQMNIGLNVPKIGLDVQGWPNYTTEQLVAYGEENERRRKALQDAYLNFVTESNDATAVANGRPQNKHLEERGIKGAEAHRAWEEEHPNLTAWSYLPSAAVIGTALAPLGAAGWSGLTALGDAAATTSAGQAITAGLAPLATAASTSVVGTPLYTWADVGLSSLFGGHGVQTAIDKGGISPTTALELLPVTRVAKPAVEMGYNTAKPVLDYSQQAIKNYQIGRAMKLQSKNMPKVNKEFRSEEWGNFLNTRNGDNYYRIANIEKETANGYSPKENYFVSHTTPWEEFSGMKGIEDPAMIGKNLPTFHNRLYEFPSKTFGTRKSSSWKGVLGDTNVDVMGKNHLYYGDTSSGVRGPVRVISDTNADYLGISPYKIGITDRPLTIKDLYDKTPVYEDIYMGNQTVLNGKELQEAIQNSTYNVFDHTPLFFMDKDATPSGITKIIHINK